MAQVPSAAASASPLPASETVSVEVAAARLGLSRSKAYKLARQNALPVPVLRFGRKIVIPARALDRLLWADACVNGDYGATDAVPAEQIEPSAVRIGKDPKVVAHLRVL